MDKVKKLKKLVHKPSLQTTAVAIEICY